MGFFFFFARVSRLSAAPSDGPERLVFDGTAALRAAEPLARAEVRRVLSNVDAGGSLSAPTAARQLAKMFAGTRPRRSGS